MEFLATEEIRVSVPENQPMLIEDKGMGLLEIVSEEDDVFVFYQGKLFATYNRSDFFSRNHSIAQLYLCHKIKQSILSKKFELSLGRTHQLIRHYEREGSRGVQSNFHVSSKNRLKISEKIGEFIAVSRNQESGPTYEELSKEIHKKFRVRINFLTIANWWQGKQRAEKKKANGLQVVAEQLEWVTSGEEVLEVQKSQLPVVQVLLGEIVSENENQLIEMGSEWRHNVISGSFILYTMLAMSGFLKPFQEKITGEEYTDRSEVTRVLLTLFFLHALRLKSIEQTKHIAEEHFGPLVGGAFHRVQNLRYAIDQIVNHESFDEVMDVHHKNLGTKTQLGDEVYYTDGHFSRYFGKYRLPKGYDPHRQMPARGRNNVYLHNSRGQNVLFFESPTNTTLSVDIEALIEKMKQVFDTVRGKTLGFDRGGFGAKCFRLLTKNGMYFTTYLKNKKNESFVPLELFAEQSMIIDGEVKKYRIYEKERTLKRYGKVRTIIFLGTDAKQVPVISTNPYLTAVAIVVGLKGRWKEENCYKFMGDHYAFDLLTTYKTETAPEKIIKRVNPDRQEVNAEIQQKKVELQSLQRDLAVAVSEVREKSTTTILEFEKTQSELKFKIKNLELDIALCESRRQNIPPKVEVNLANECVITKQKRRLLINLVKAMNYNCEKWLQDLFLEIHPKKDETLSLIRRVITQPGRIRSRGNGLEVELERLDNTTHATSLDKVIEKLNQFGYFRLPDGRELKFWQAAKSVI